ncbi:Arm DNA-binding domain-containing protein [Evansella sp. AB-P1]|uniref:Arm DNA-binding domain-containing protein n=1 Tax=Evansella sp. AB-P1 TaxID=3037653 RepID=UPI00241C42FE|nr:Arm DNA-binding domain-containing protein [Evansella sp. AB-P1]MDG5789608.1 Arm DNA-binding domain-containing protein [Evansella sp. AB-P1]
MTGHVRYDKKTKNYLYVIEVGPKGNRKRKVKRGFKNQREAKKAMNLAMADLQKEESSILDSNDYTVSEYLDYWLSSYAKSSTAPNTYKGYERMIRVHIAPELGPKKLGTLTPRDVQDYYNRKVEVLSAQTVKHHHRLLCKALNYSVDWEFVERNVAKKAKSPKPERYKPTTYTESELKRLFEAAKENLIYYPIIFSASHTGARLGELRAL